MSPGTNGWQAEAEELERRYRSAESLGGDEAVRKQHERGQLTIRERIDLLCDAGSFQEVGKLTGSSTREDGAPPKIVPAPYVMGLAQVDGRPVAVGGEDFTIRGGTSWKGDRRKGGQGGFVEDLAFHYKIPLINLIDGSGGSVVSAKRRGHSVFPGVDGFERSVQLLSHVPVISAVLGTAAGGPAGRAILSHWSVMVQGTSAVFAAGPAVVRRSLGENVSREELGGSHRAVDLSGTIDNVAPDEHECLRMVKRFLSYVPQNVWELPPRAPAAEPIGPEDDLLTIVPRDRRRPYDMRKVLEMIVDGDSVFEIQPTYGRSIVTALARLNGHVIGLIANNPLFLGGALDVAASRKQTHFMELCDCFHIPLIFFVDVPGFMVGTRAESEATLREGMRSVYVGLQITVPVVTVVIRKCYGMAGMATCGKNDLDLKIAWPSAEWGSLPLEGGVAVAYRREIASSADPAQRERELEQELREFSSPLLTAEAFGVEDIIDPRHTRRYLTRFVDAMQGRLQLDRGPKLRAGVRP